jgi:hypothetical protein
MRQRLRTKVKNLLDLIEYLSSLVGMLPWARNHRKLSFLLDLAEWFQLIILFKNHLFSFLYTILPHLWNLRWFDGQGSSREHTGRTFLGLVTREFIYYVKVEIRNSTARKFIVHNSIAIIDLGLYSYNKIRHETIVYYKLLYNAF